MAKLIMCKGLPGSGKTTWALREMEIEWSKGYDPMAVKLVRVNKDDIRVALGEAWSHESEKKVIRERDRLIRHALEHGSTVISDDTNLAYKHEKRLRELAKEYDATFEVKTFNTHLEECIRRDSLRTGKAKVGEKVIREMAKQYELGPKQVQTAQYFNDPQLPRAIICDLDGTLALSDGLRNPYDHENCDGDLLNTPIANLVNNYADLGFKILYVSGREHKYESQTVTFLNRHSCPTDPLMLFMRACGDHRPDNIVKRELFDNNIAGKWFIEFVLDDRNRVVNMWRRSLGLTCLQVAEGDF